MRDPIWESVAWTSAAWGWATAAYVTDIPADRVGNVAAAIISFGFVVWTMLRRDR